MSSLFAVGKPVGSSGELVRGHKSARPSHLHRCGADAGAFNRERVPVESLASVAGGADPSPSRLRSPMRKTSGYSRRALGRVSRLLGTTMRRAGAGPIDQYLRWKEHNAAVGCIFARYLANKPAEFGQRMEVVKGGVAVDVAVEIDDLVSQFIADGTLSAATLLFPAVKQLATVVQVALALEQKSGWHVERTHLPSTPVGPVIAFRIARDIPLTPATTVPSEALVLGPFDPFPATRQAPVTALEIFVGTPPPADDDGSPTQKANLAHVRVSPPVTRGVFDYMWQNSVNGRLKSLNGVDDGRAKAKVAFVVPLVLAQTLGCAP